MAYKIYQTTARGTVMMRSDERIKEDVEAHLNRNRRVDSSAVKVEVTDGVVSLSGTLPSLSAGMAAVETIENVAGVRSVINEIQVKVPKPA
jgi:osmotically-inducible protein OsmY